MSGYRGLAQRPRVAVVQPGMGFGGSEAGVLWTLEALKGACDVSLITIGEVDLQRLNAYYGSRLDPQDFSVRHAPMPIGLRKPERFAALRGRFLQRYVQRVAPEFDVLISTYGLVDFGRPGLALVADFSFVEEWRFSLHPGVRSWNKWWYGRGLVRRVYLALCDWVSPVSPDVWKRSVILANSNWTADLMRTKLNVQVRTVYPPVAGNFPEVSFSDRENGFVCLGRISPEKRVDAVIDILSQVRRRGHNVHLHLLGGLDDSPYSATIKKLADQNKDWVYLEGWAVGEKKKVLLASHRYGIHGRENEPFGIAVAEMANAGCIVFVPNGGGQVEIVNHPALIFKDEADAVNKIEAVLNNSAEQETLRAHLRQNAGRFSPQSFQAQIRQEVEAFLERTGSERMPPAPARGAEKV
jgi:glycosyltransferase involved in cell wall biosynthesis